MRSRGALLRRNLPLLLAAFTLSAVSNIVPQGLLLRAEVPERELLLSGMLLFGTAAAMAGVRAARRGWAAGRVGVATGVLAGGIGLAAHFGTTSVLAWALLGALVRFAGNHTTQATDRAAVLGAGEARAANDSIGMTLRLAGTALPLVAFGVTWWSPGTRGLLVALVVAGLVGATALPALPPRAPGGVDGRLTAADRALLLYGGLLFGALAVYAAQLAFLLDHHGIEQPTAWAGGLLLLAHVTAVPPLLLRTGKEAGWLDLVLPALILAASLLPLQVGVAVGPLAMSISAGLVGLGYGASLAALRTRVSAGEVAGRPLLAAYNDLANVAGLGAFAALGVLAWLGEHGLPFYAAVPVAIQVAAVLAAFVSRSARGA